jgi:hypothetical protein
LAFQLAANNQRGVLSVPYSLPGPTETRVIYVQGTRGMQEDSTLAGLVGTAGFHEWVGVNLLPSTMIVARDGLSWYWHTNGQIGAEGSMHHAYMLSIVARQFRYFDRVMAIDNEFGNQILQPRNSFASRY